MAAKRMTMTILLLGLLSLSACEFPRLLEQEDAPLSSNTETTSPSQGVAAASRTPSPTVEGESVGPTQDSTPQSPANPSIGIDNLEQLTVQARIESDLNSAFSAFDLSNDGRFLAFAQWGDPQVNVYVWDLQEGQLLPPLDFHTAYVTDVAFSPDGEQLASCSQDGEVALWEVGAWNLLNHFPAHERGASALAFSPDSQLLAVGGQRDQLGVWTLGDFERVNFFDGFGPHTVDQVIFSADGSQYFADRGYAHITVWNTADGEMVQHFRGEACIGGFDLSSDESRLAYSSECSDAQAPHDPLAAIAVRDVASGDVLVYGDRRDVSTTLYYSADDTLILTSSGQTLRFWDARDGSLVDQLLVGNFWFEYMLSDDGSLLIIGGPGGQILIYAVESPEE